MAKRTLLLGAACLLLLGAGGVTPTSQKTIPVKWSERLPLASGGYVAFQVTKIVVSETGWEATARMVNKTGSALVIYNRLPASHGVFSCTSSVVELYRKSNPAPNYGVPTRGQRVYPATRFRPWLPYALEPGTSWSGTLSGRDALPKGRALRLCFGYFAPADRPESGFSWITDHTFRR